MAEELSIESNPRAVKGWSVSTRPAIEKGTVVGRAAPLLVHQTLANREQVLVCASCHRFVGTPAAQLAMLEGIPPQASTGTITGISANAKKRRRVAGSVEGGGANSISGLPSAGRAQPRRIAVARASPGRLPGLPPLLAEPNGKEAPKQRGQRRAMAGTGVPSASQIDGEDHEEVRAGIFRCTGGAPCDDVYCSAGCRESALAAGHGLICIGGSEGGSPLFEFHRYAVRTSETYLIAAAAVAAALSSSPVPSSSPPFDSSTEPSGGEAVGEGMGTKPFEALEGWGEPYLHVPSVGGGNDGQKGMGKEGKGDAKREGGGREGEGGGAVAAAPTAVKGIGVSIEEAEEAWSMLTAGLMHRLRSGECRFSCQTPTRSTPTGDRARERRQNDKHALSLDFFLRMVRALGRHLAPISVPSPLVSYCASLIQADPETKARALPWLVPAVKRAGPFGGADGGGTEEGTVVAGNAARKHAAGRSGETSELVETTGEDCGSDNYEGRSVEDDKLMRGERGLCRLVQASTAAAAGTVESPFPPLSVVGLLPPHCSPQHSCVPNVQLEASLLQPVATVPAHDANRGNDNVSGRRCRSGDGDASRTAPKREDTENGANGVDEQRAATLPTSSLTLSALRVGLVTLRGIREGEELFAPYVGLSRPVEERRRELASRFPARHPGVVGSAAAIASAADDAPAGAASAPRASWLAPSSPLPKQAQEDQFSCSCPRCLFEAEGDYRSHGRGMLKVLADQALEEGRHDNALELYRASLATPPSSSSSPCPPRVGAAADVVNYRKTSPEATDSRAAAQHEERAADEPATAAGRKSELVTGDALHGVGVALLAAGKFREACRAWERGVREAPDHPALRAQANKEEAYRPIGGENGTATMKETQDGRPPPMLSQENLSSPTADGAEGLCGDGGGGGHEHFASTPGGVADIFLSEAPVLSAEECRGVIKAAESYSQVNGGWTTSRHYAVPTTDLPVHVLEPLLPWFRSLVSERLFPALAANFGLRAGARRVFVHDAFVVRYEEGKQRHLPLHRDQSTHSFTIALNGLDEYTGGGTFFPCLGRSLRPAEGHALSFRGDILHGGDPLISGVRYIIACFCYYDDSNSVVDGDGEPQREETAGGGRTCTEDAGLHGSSPGNCTTMNVKEKDERVDRGSYSTSGVVVGDSDGEGSNRSQARRNGQPEGGDAGTGGGKGGIEFRSDRAFSFSFGFG
ncbi:unnamed protein product [Scytosiphon promiscuus]